MMESDELVPQNEISKSASTSETALSPGGAEVDEGDSESGPTDPIMKIPNEVWVLILSQLSQKELVQARTVWKKFREVVDAHFEFTVIVHDGKTDLNRVYELRIRDCLVTRLLRDVEIFQFPTLIRRIRFWGPVNVNCFQRIMDKAVCNEELSLTKFALMQDDLLGEGRLNGFSKVKKLELLGYMCKDESETVTKNARKIFSYAMPDLEKLTVNFHCDIASINEIAISFLEFVSRHNRLQNLQVSLVPEASHPNESLASRTTTIVIPKDVEQLLTQVQLNMLRITTATKDLPIWTALLNSQTRLQDLRLHLSEGGLLTIHTAYVIGIPFDMVRDPIVRNATTLTFIELKDIRLTPVNGSLVDATPMDASIFRYASNLKRLILYRNGDDYRRFPQYPDQPNIINLMQLPATIEVLEISRFYCRSDELQFVVDMLENLKTIVLLHTGSLSRLGVHGGIVESIAAKSEILTMNVTPLNYHNSAENKKYDKIKLKYQMNDGDHLYYDFERYRKGLPQPRPPTVITVESSHETRQRRSQGFAPVFCRRWANRVDGACGRFRTRALYTFRRAAVARARHIQCCNANRRRPRLLSPESVGNGQCSTANDNLSGLFHSLDLQVSREQQCLTESLECAHSSSSNFSTAMAPDGTRRVRRWSGDGVMLDILKRIT